MTGRFLVEWVGEVGYVRVGVNRVELEQTEMEKHGSP